MSLNRFQQLKRYLHISDPQVELDLKHWHAKVDPLASILRERFQKYYLPGTKFAIDEMVVRFSGRSRHTLKIRNKPIKEGYKIIALCDHGYTYDFLWYSSTQGIAELTVSAASSSTPLPIASSLTPTSKGVLHLAQSLPSGFRWNLLLDNYLTNIPLFEQLLGLGIGAAGTTRVDSAGFPKSLKIETQEAKKVLPWGHISGEVVGNVCCLVWQDNSSVLFMTSYHDIRKKVERLRRRPNLTSTNASIVRTIFKEASRKLLPIQEFIDDYNYNMGAADIADQLRSYYSTQQTSCRNWLPLFYWLLDTSLVNAYRIQKTMNPGRNLRSEPFHFRSEVVDQLILDGIHSSELAPSPTLPSPFPSASSYLSNPPDLKVAYISCPQYSTSQSPPKNSKPTPVSYPPPATHNLEQRPTRTLCIFCRWRRSQAPLEATKVKSVNLGCCECNVTLCRDFFSFSQYQ